jgi:hypothetical protein
MEVTVRDDDRVSILEIAAQLAIRVNNPQNKIKDILDDFEEATNEVIVRFKNLS